MIDLKRFRVANGLTQTELGDYLGIKKSFVSKIEKGGAKLPEDKFAKLQANDMGWDISFLLEDVQGYGDDSGQNSGEGNIGKITGYAELLMLHRENELLRQQIEALKAEKTEYWEMIKELTKK